MTKLMTAHPKADLAASPGPDRQGLTEALIESRQRWRDLARFAFDLCFETDAAGRLIFLAPEQAFGWQTDQLLDLPGDSLLLGQGDSGPDDRAIFNPFRPAAPVRGHRAWLRRPDGGRARVLISSAPIHGRDGAVAGARGAIQDITAQEDRERLLAETLLCQQTVSEIGRRMRRAVLPDMVVRIGLEELLDATGSRGAIIVACDQPLAAADADRPSPDRARPHVIARAGTALTLPDDTVLDCVREAAAGAVTPWTRTVTRPDCRLILSGVATRFSDPVVLLLWRERDRDWLDGDDRLAASFLASLGSVLEHDQVQRELARQSGADTLTGLLTRECFATEVNRRLDRLDAEKLAATLMVIGLDRFRDINDRHGHEQGDEVLRQTARILRDAVRPTDLAARLGSDVFALWLDGADQFTAAERAETLCQQGIAVTLGTSEQVTLRVSVGLATRAGGSYETIDNLLEQSHAALGAIKLAGGGRWHFYNEGTVA